MKKDSTLDYFCILAGGGVRGTAYIGVLKILDKLNVNIKGLAGSSVGAIIAGLYAVGYSHDELHEILFNVNYDNFRDFSLPFGRDYGICKGENLISWYKEMLEKKFYGEEYNKNNKPITFKDLDKDLIIVATDISNVRLKEYSRFKTPHTEVVQAVRASTSIPGFYRPVWEGDDCLVDGDIIKNLPLWTMSENISGVEDRILEFRLEGSDTNRKITNPFEYFNAVIDTSTNISTDFIINLYGQNDKFDFVKIDTGSTSIIDFAISNEHKEFLVKAGADATTEYFTKTLLEKKKRLKEFYKRLLQEMSSLKRLIGKNNLKEAHITLSDIYVTLSENREFLNKNLFNNLLEFKKLFIANLSKVILINKWMLKDKKNVVNQLKISIILIEQELSEIENFETAVKKLESKIKTA